MISLREKCPYSELFWSAFSCIRIEYEEIIHISPYSVQMREYADQNNSKYGHFSAVSFGEILRLSKYFNNINSYLLPKTWFTR